MLSSSAHPPAPPPLTALAQKNRGRACLGANQLKEALDIFAEVVRSYPGDAEAQCLLGDCYLAGGDAVTALRLYRRAQALEPRWPHLAHRLHLAQTESVEQDEAEAAPAEPAALARLLQRLLGGPAPITKADVARAAHILAEIVHSPRPVVEVAKRLNEIDALLPALLELNIRQARAEGRPDVAEALRAVLGQLAAPTRPQ